jgi:hypothetical protein
VDSSSLVLTNSYDLTRRPCRDRGEKHVTSCAGPASSRSVSASQPGVGTEPAADEPALAPRLGECSRYEPLDGHAAAVILLQSTSTHSP